MLAREFDRMVERVAESRRQLVDQSFQAGFAELAKGVLHNLGNAMTPLGVRLSKLGDRLRDAPAADVELALAELATDDAGVRAARGSRRNSTPGAAANWRHASRMRRADVEVVQRQATIVQTALERAHALHAQCATWSSRCAFPIWSRRHWRSCPMPAVSGWWWTPMSRCAKSVPCRWRAPCCG